MTIHDLTFSYHFGKSDKNQRVSRPLHIFYISSIVYVKECSLTEDI